MMYWLRQLKQYPQTAKENGIEIHLTNMSGTKHTKKLPVTEFDIDETSNVINKCRGGHIPTHTGVSGGQTYAIFPMKPVPTVSSVNNAIAKSKSRIALSVSTSKQ